MTRSLAHVLTVTPDGDDEDDFAWTITCPYEPRADVPGRQCVTWWQCDCKLSDEARDALSDDGDGPCASSPTGLHHVSSYGPAWLGAECWANACDSTCDEVWEIHRDHGVGTFLVAIDDADESSIRLAVLASLPELAASAPPAGGGQ